jgi:nicotinamidase-related amidase
VPEFPIIPAKSALLFFDTLNVYLHPKDAAQQAAVDELGIIPILQKANRGFRDAGLSIFYAQADHRPDHRDVAPLIVGMGHDGLAGDRVFARRAAVSGSWEAEVIEEIEPQPGDYVIKKHRWSTFHQTHFELSLRTAGIDTLLLAGGATEVGIASTAYSARDLDLNQIVLRDACTSGRAEVKDFFMDHVFPAFTRVMTVDEALALVAR